MKNNKGFSIVETLLILVIVGLIAGVGWYVWNARNKTNQALNSADAANSSIIGSTKTKANKDVTASWVAYSSKEGKFSLKYSKTWTRQTANLESCSASGVMLGGDSKSVGKCGGDGPGAFGQINVVSVDGDHRSDYDFGNDYTNVNKKEVKVDGVTGTRVEGTAFGQTNGEGIPGFADGTKVVAYIFYTNNRTYIATYDRQAGYPDVLNDFEIMVTKTLKFSS